MSKIAREISKKASVLALAAALTVQAVPVSAAEVEAKNDKTVVETKSETEAAPVVEKKDAVKETKAVTEVKEASKEKAEVEGDEEVTFPDAELTKAVRAMLRLKDNEKLTKKDVEKLNSLDIDEKFNIKSLDGIEQCKNLNIMWIDYRSDMDLSALKNINTVTQLYVYGEPVDLNYFSSFTKLESLEVDRTNNTNMDAVKNMKELFSLELYEAPNMTDISGVSGLNNLAQLRIMGSKEDSDTIRGKLEDITPIRNLPRLSKLDFSLQSISNIEVISTLPKLNNAVFYKCNISDISFMLHQSKGIESIIWLDGNKIADPTPLIKQVYTYETAIMQEVKLKEIVTKGGDVVYKIPYGDYVTSVEIDEKDGKYNPETKEITFFNVTSDKQVTYKVRVQKNLDYDKGYDSMKNGPGYDYRATVTQGFKIEEPEQVTEGDNSKKEQVSGGNKVAASKTVTKNTSISKTLPKTGDAGVLGVLSLAVMSLAGTVKFRKRK